MRFGRSVFKEGPDLLVFASVDLRRDLQSSIIGSETGAGGLLDAGRDFWDRAPSPKSEGGGAYDPLT